MRGEPDGDLYERRHSNTMRILRPALILPTSCENGDEFASALSLTRAERGEGI